MLLDKYSMSEENKFDKCDGTDIVFKKYFYAITAGSAVTKTAFGTFIRRGNWVKLANEIYFDQFLWKVHIPEIPYQFDTI